MDKKLKEQIDAETKEINGELAAIFDGFKRDEFDRNGLQKILNKVSPVKNQADPYWELAAEGVLYASALSLLFEKEMTAEKFTIAAIKERAVGHKGKKDFNDIKHILTGRLEHF
jgi:hypothetical protein